MFYTECKKKEKVLAPSPFTGTDFMRIMFIMRVMFKHITYVCYYHYNIPYLLQTYFLNTFKSI